MQYIYEFTVAITCSNTLFIAQWHHLGSKYRLLLAYEGGIVFTAQDPRARALIRYLPRQVGSNLFIVK